MSSPSARKALSPAESSFLDAYNALRLRHLHATVLGHLPEMHQGLASGGGGGDGSGSGGGMGGGGMGGGGGGGDAAEAAIRAAPSPHKHVLVEVVRDLGEVLLKGETESLAMRPGVTFSAEYSAVRDYIRDGSMVAL